MPALRLKLSGAADKRYSLNGIEFTASSPGNVEVKIPRAWAVKLGLVPAETQ